MYDVLLNNDYYKNLINTFSANVEFNSSLLPITNFNKINLSFIQKALNKSTGYDIVIKVPSCFDNLLQELYSNLYLFIANTQFYQNYINPDLTVGEILVRKIGKRNKKYKIISITNNQITLLEQKKETLKDFNGPATIYADKKNVIKEFVPITRPLKKESLNNFLKLFSSLNNLDINEDYFPTKFGSVSLFIGSKKMFESFRNISIYNGNLYNCIPCYYINRDGKESDTLGIEPLIYFAPTYSIAHQQFIKNNKGQNKIKVNNIVLFNDGFDELQQIISDQPENGFRILGICTTPIENRSNLIKYWDWLKEEINFIESL